MIRPAAIALEGSGAAPPAAIDINETGVGGEHYPVMDYQVDDLVRYHKGAWPLALDLFEEGYITDVDAATLKARLMALGVNEATLADQSPFIDPATAANFE